MFRFFQYLLLLSFFTFKLQAQSISISSVTSQSGVASTLCLGRKASIKYSLKGDFASNNTLIVQVKSSYGGENTWQNLNTKDTLGTLIFNLPESFTNYVYSNGGYSNGDFRVISTAPIVTSKVLEFNPVYGSPEVELVSIKKKVLYPYESVPIELKLSGSTPIELITSDSTKITEVYIDRYFNQNTFNVNPRKTGFYYLLKASNLCGEGKVKGGFNITVIDKSLQVTGISNPHLCRKGKFDVYYKSFGNWEDGTKFRIRLLKKSYEGYYSSFYDFDATNLEGMLSTEISETIPLGNYDVQIITVDNPVIESRVYQSNVVVHDEAKVEFTSQSSTISYGQTASIDYTVSGYGPFKIEFSNGLIFNESGEDNFSRSYKLEVSPEITTLYSIKSFMSLCKVGEGKNKVLISVKTGIRTDSLKAGKYCVGNTCEVKFFTNKLINIGSSIKVRLFNSSDGWKNSYYKDLDGTVISENVVSFTLPINFPEGFSNQQFYASVFADGLVNNTTVSPNSIEVYTKPTAKISNTTEVNLENPQSTDVVIELRGGGPYEILLSNNTTYQVGLNNKGWVVNDKVPIYFSKSGSISVSTVTNMCGTNTNLNPISKNVNVENVSFSLELTSESPQPIDICAGKKTKINLNAIGNFGQDNQFTLVLVSDKNNLSQKNLGIIESGVSDILIPSDLEQGFYHLKIISNNPLFYSNKLQIAVKTSPTISIINNTPRTLMMGETPNIVAGVTGGGQVNVLYKDGTNALYDLGNNTNSFYLGKPLSQTTVYGVQSLSNACGVGRVNSKDVVVKVVPYKIICLFNNYNNSLSGKFCRNFKIPISFYTVGKVDQSVTFELQIAKYGDTNYTTIISGIKQSPVLFTIPESFTDDKYSIRIVSSDNLVQSEAVDLNYKYLPELDLKLLDGTSEDTINAGESVTLFVKLKDYDFDGARYLILDDKNINTSGYFAGSSVRHNVGSIKENTVFTLAAVSNECGFGKVSGSVKITTRTGMTMAFLNSSSNVYCVGGSIQANIKTLGTFEKDNVFKILAIDDKGLSKTLLSTSNDGNLFIPLNEQLKKGNYLIQIESSSPYLKKDVSYIVLNEPLDVSLFGNSTINQGNPAYIMLKNNKELTNGDSNNVGIKEYVSYELSDGTSGSLYLNSNGTSSILIYPSSTITYTLKSIQNVCGVGKVSGSATVTVISNIVKKVELANSSFSSKYFCRGAVHDIFFVTTGTFSAQNRFKVQISDSSGSNYKDLVSEGNISPLKVTIPMDFPQGNGYYIRVAASDTDAIAVSSNFPFTILEAITARFDSASYFFNQNSPITINLTFTGTPPFTFYIGADELSAKMYSTNTNNYGITLNPVANTAYRLFSVSNGTCGTGTILSPSTVKIELVTALEELGKLGISVFPNPTSDVIQIEAKDKELSIQLIDFSGKIVQEQVLRGEQKQVDISKNASGTYFLRVLKETKEATFKIIKL